MATIKGMVTEIIREFTTLQNSPNPIVDSSDDSLLPRMIPAGNGRSIIITKNIDQRIQLVGQRLQENDRALAGFGNKDLYTAMRHAFGAALAEIDLNNDRIANAGSVLTRVRGIVSRQAQNNAQQREYCFGCTLFGNPNIKTFKIGAVRFEPRTDWLARKVADGAVTRTTQRRVEKAWQGTKLKKRKTSLDNIRERELLRAIGPCNFVCSVVTRGFASGMGQEKALLAARIAMTSIALLWQSPSWALDGLNLFFDRRLHDQTSLMCMPGKKILSTSRISHMPQGPTLQSSEWEALFTNRKSHFDVSAEVLDYYLNPQQSASRQKLMSALFHALLWFHEGCRERSPLLAVVKFAASMDALACGKKEKGILSLSS
jgi:hypothetical protein